MEYILFEISSRGFSLKGQSLVKVALLNSATQLWLKLFLYFSEQFYVFIEKVEENK